MDIREKEAHCIRYSAVHEKDNDMREYDLETEDIAEAEAGALYAKRHR